MRIYNPSKKSFSDDYNLHYGKTNFFINNENVTYASVNGTERVVEGFLERSAKMHLPGLA